MDNFEYLDTFVHDESNLSKEVFGVLCLFLVFAIIALVVVPIWAIVNVLTGGNYEKIRYGLDDSGNGYTGNSGKTGKRPGRGCGG